MKWRLSIDALLWRAVMALILAVAAASSTAAAAPIPIRVVVVTMFEIGADSGDTPGEFQAWVERLPLDEKLDFPQGYRALRLNREKGILGLVTGVGTAHAAASIMALGMDPRFDLSRAYWVVAGIAGADPADMSLGSAAWAEWVVDGDLAHEIDAREIPPDWSTGYTPLDRAKPFPQPVPEDTYGNAYQLDRGLVDWAWRLTKDVALPDSPALAKSRAAYVGFPQALKPPFVRKGDVLDAETFWHGTLLNRWANDWVAYWTHGQGNFVTSAMEDSGTLQSLTFLAHAGKVDRRRVLVLRTASNYTMQPPGVSAAENLARETAGYYSAFLPSLEAAYRIGSPVVLVLAGHWDRYADHLPSELP
jgi:purine nucleoside permease